MTTIIRSDVKLSAPKAGTLVLPTLGISGVLHRWHAENAQGALNGAVTSVPDSVGAAPLITVAGSPTIKEGANGRRYLDLAGGSSDNTISSDVLTQDYTSFSLAALYYWDTLPVGGSFPAITTIPAMANNSALNLLDNRYSTGTWNSGGTAIVTPALTPARTGGWHTVFIGYDKTGNEMAAMDGIAATRGQGGGTSDAITKFALRGRPALHSKIVEAVYVDHVLSNAEITTLHNSLIAQIPT